jgi:hypothetical protein
MSSPWFQPMSEFCHVVRLMRAVPAEYQTMALHAAMHWSDEKLHDVETSGILPGRPGPEQDKPANLN